ncbi:unnamed protein product [Dracunculus medinensis]|uniref:Cysteine-rich DPF motif domain-containing protein 1 n=1 Tax=Dracunculus medinensis TaxID=318479 RepID=A0A0N4UE38_DRAME|nr:unnamed protein product [Dracunculus medinensis]
MFKDDIRFKSGSFISHLTESYSNKKVQWKVAASHHRQNLIVAFVECLKNVNMDSSSGILECVCFFPFNLYCQTWFSVRRHRVILHSWKYNEEVYYILDPFRNRNKVDERRLSSKIGEVNIKSGRNDSKLLNILDYFVLGAICAICGQSVCFDELCSVFYYKTFCATCVMREQMHFPKEIIEV